MNHKLWLRLSLIVSVALLCHCRADLPDDDTRLSSTGDVSWFNSYGEAGDCEPQASRCREVDNDKPFIDACVAAGYKAKTCGCSVKCSGDIGYKKERRREVVAASNEDESACTRDDISYLRTMKATLVKTRELADCINGHVCQGHTVYCTGSDAEISHNLRRLAKTKCETEVAETFCSTGRVDSWECPDAVVGTLSREWAAAFQSDDAPLRLCFQSLVCNDTESRCAPNLLDRARSIKAALDSSECKYWFESFCRLGSDGAL